jgi:hypothetical protein
MESGHLDATVILSLNLVEVYQTANGKKSLVTTGPLNILYITSYNCFLLQVNNFNYHLSKEIPVLSSPGKGDCYPSYVFPNMEGFYVIKVVKISSPEALCSLETILSNHCQLGYEEPEEIGGGYTEITTATIEKAKGEEEEKDKKGKAPKTKTEIASNIIYKGGELAKTGLIKSAELLSKGISKVGEIAQKKMKKGEEKDVSESTVAKVKIANTATDTALKFTQVQVQGLMTVGKEIGKEVGRKIEKTETAQKAKNHKHYGTAMQVGKSTVHAVASLYEGMVEAVCIVGKGVGDTTTKIVTHKYGQQVGNVTQEGLNAVGNVGKMTQVYKQEAAKAFEKATEKK